MPTQQPGGAWKSQWIKGGRLCWGWCLAPTRAGKLLPPAREWGQQGGEWHCWHREVSPGAFGCTGRVCGMWTESRGEARGAGGFPPKPCRDAPGLMPQPGHPLPAAISPQK